MSEEELKKLEKTVKRNKRIASERASELHDLVEDRLPAAYRELPEMAEAAFQACLAWEEASKALAEAQGE